MTLSAKTQLTIVANIYVVPEKVDLVKQELMIMVAKTRVEEGCINYDLHQDNANPAHFMFYENWQSRDLWQVHMTSQHIKDYRLAVDGCIEKVVMHEMTPV